MDWSSGLLSNNDLMKTSLIVLIEHLLARNTLRMNVHVHRSDSSQTSDYFPI